MFLTALEKQNPAMISAAYQLWQQGKILPDSYLIDVDQFEINAKLLLTTAQKHNIKLYAMGKQFGRNPLLYKLLLDLGYQGIVAVDYKEARRLYQHNLPAAHIGHLVQPPNVMLREILQHQPEVITVYSIEKARKISEVTQQLKRVQPLLLKIYQDSDLLYPGQEGGFSLNELPNCIDQISSLPNVKIVGLTHFPCMLFNDEQQKTLATPNLHTLVAGRTILEQKGIHIEQLNAPSASSCETLPLLASYGVTHAEPGHALTGTLPANQQGQQPEKIAMLYLSEISHHANGVSYCFGGGYYRRGNLHHALIINHLGHQRSRVLPVDPHSIDYCLRLDGLFPIGDPVIMSFRSQIFVTRSDLVLVKGISQGNPHIMGVYDSLGNLISTEHNP